jgi:hypothetical protein
MGLQREIDTTEQRLAELAAEREDLNVERINAEDLKRVLAAFDSA